MFASRVYGLPRSNICPFCLRVSLRQKRFFQVFVKTSNSVTKNYPEIRVSQRAFEDDYFSTNTFARQTIQRFSRKVWAGVSKSLSSKVEKTVADAGECQSSAANSSAVGSRNGHNLPPGSSTSKVSGEPPPRIRQESQGTHNIPLDASSRLSTYSSQLPARSLRRLLTLYLSLSKPRLTFLVVLTTATTYSLYPVPELLSPLSDSTSSLSTLTLAFLLAGTTLSSASANAFNMFVEPAHDGKMSRTRNRPLVRGLISSRGAFIFALASGIAGIVTLNYGVNPTVAQLAAANIIIYAGAYTFLKRISVVNTWVGALVGGIPPLMGWAAAAGHFNTSDSGWQGLLLGEKNVGGWLLAALLFAWQFPHFNALSWSAREEYRRAGYKMLACVNQGMNGRVALRYSILMFPLCVGLAAVGVTDWGFAATSSVVNGWMCWHAAKFWWKSGTGGSARGLFWASVWHLPIVLVLAMAHKKGLWKRVAHGVGISWKEDEIDEGADEPIIQAYSLEHKRVRQYPTNG